MSPDHGHSPDAVLRDGGVAIKEWELVAAMVRAASDGDTGMFRRLHSQVPDNREGLARFVVYSQRVLADGVVLRLKTRSWEISSQQIEDLAEKHRGRWDEFTKRSTLQEFCDCLSRVVNLPTKGALPDGLEEALTDLMALGFLLEDPANELVALHGELSAWLLENEDWLRELPGW